MKLLASVLSVAAADYACCPYDEYGVPDATCSDVLTEKSPFADLITADASGSIVPEESYACKAWEANAGAALEEHKGTAARDWGSCGYQRHFPWYNKKPTAAADPLVKLGLFGATGTFDPLYEVFGTGGTYASTGGTGWNMLSLTKGSFSGQAEGTMPITGEVHLGGICKLFVPVQKEFIRQVSIAGVHINNARIVAGSARAFSAEMNAVVVGSLANDPVDSTWKGKFHAGTAYCFSVVNIAEFMTNRANLIANANVAGTDSRTATDNIWYADDQGKQYKNTAVVGPPVVTPGDTVEAQFGTIWPGYDSTTAPAAGTAGQKNSGQHKVNMGSNFDVVVHFDSAWCSSHWELIDMQKSDDHGAGTGTDSAGDNLKGFENTAQGAAEAKMDAWDKRLPINIGSCGLCKDRTGITRSPVTTASVSSDCLDNAWTADAAGATATMDLTENFNYNTGTAASPSDCVNVNSYDSGSKRWPNAGAWAAFYSFITCARSDYMIYGEATRTVRTVSLSTTAANHLVENKPTNAAAAGSATHTSQTLLNNDNRMVVVGGWHQDYRHGAGACVRFNIRQVGEYIEYCADGDEEEFNSKTTATLYKNPTGDTKEWSQNKNMRCTWNWNYNELSNGGFDAESWFDSIDPLHMQVWSSGVANQAAAEMFVDEPLPGSTNTGGYKAAVTGGTLTDSVTINVMIQASGKNVNGVSPGAFVKPTSLIMDGTYATGSTVSEFDPQAATPTNPPVANFPASNLLYDNTKGAYATITLACDNTGKYNGGATDAERMRDHFPDCFFGDEIHGQWQWDSGLAGVDSAADTSAWRFYAMLH